MEERLCRAEESLSTVYYNGILRYAQNDVLINGFSIGRLATCNSHAVIRNPASASMSFFAPQAPNGTMVVILAVLKKQKLKTLISWEK